MEQTQNKIEQLRHMCAYLSYFLKAHFKSLSDVEITLTISKEDIHRISEELLKEAQTCSVIYPEFNPVEPVRFTKIRFYPFTLVTLKEEKTNGTTTAAAEQSIR
jgi:hypothetical protein